MEVNTLKIFLAGMLWREIFVLIAVFDLRLMNDVAVLQRSSRIIPADLLNFEIVISKFSELKYPLK